MYSASSTGNNYNNSGEEKTCPKQQKTDRNMKEYFQGFDLTSTKSIYLLGAAY